MNQEGLFRFTIVFIISPNFPLLSARFVLRIGLFFRRPSSTSIYRAGASGALVQPQCLVTHHPLLYHSLIFAGRINHDANK